MRWKSDLRDLLLGLTALAALTGLMLWPQEVMDAGQDGLALCVNTIIPSLFPFFVVSSLIVDLGLTEYLGHLLEGAMRPLFRVNGRCAAALVLGLIGGYPVGARTTAQLYQSGQCSRSEAQRLLGFCNNAGPAFLLGAVGTGVFGSARIGLVLLSIHMLSALLVGLLFRFSPGGSGVEATADRPTVLKRPGPAAVFTSAVRSSGSAVLNVCAFVLLFGVVLRLLDLFGLLGWLARGTSALLSPLGLSYPWAKRLLSGMLELTNGAASLPAGDQSGSIPMAAFLLGWGGLSVQCQTMSVLEGTDLSIRSCLVGKLLHGLISAALAALTIRWLPGVVSVSLTLDSPVSIAAAPDFWTALAISLACSAALMALALGLHLKGCKKRGGDLPPRAL